MSFDITVILTVYNQPIESIVKSIRSVAKQEGCSYQLIVTDDHSEVDLTIAIEDACKIAGLKHYVVVRHPANYQTVGNLLNIEKYVEGKYVKAFGAGDKLFSGRTLSDIVAFCERYAVKAGFGNMVKDVDGRRFIAPKNATDYPPMGKQSRMRLFEHQIGRADWIPGCSQFFEAQTFFMLLNCLYDVFYTRYCEDFACLIALEKMDVFHLDETILQYEFGTGISTAGSMSSRRRMYADHSHLYKKIAKARPFGHSYFIAHSAFLLRKFIALHTPFYRFCQKALLKTYSGRSDV